MVEYFRNIVDTKTLKIFNDFLNHQDKYVDDRGDVYDKLMTPADSNWPMKELVDLLDKCIPDPYEIENADFVRSNFFTRLHTDTADGDQKRLGKNIIIPLNFDTHASTAVFDNKWFGPSAKFTKIKIPPYEYTINNVGDQPVYIENICLLRDAMIENNKPVTEYQGHQFNSTVADIKWLNELINKRHKADPRISDYTGITNLNNNDFPKDFHEKWLSHIPIETLDGLSVPEIAEWCVGDVISFDRQHLHSGTSCSKQKTFLAVFTYRI